eukprot:348818_1
MDEKKEINSNNNNNSSNNSNNSNNNNKSLYSFSKVIHKNYMKNNNNNNSNNGSVWSCIKCTFAENDINSHVCNVCGSLPPTNSNHTILLLNSSNNSNKLLYYFTKVMYENYMKNKWYNCYNIYQKINKIIQKNNGNTLNILKHNQQMHEIIFMPNQKIELYDKSLHHFNEEK